MTPNKAFILAAGFGKRMQPLTLERPKPMAEIDGRSLIMRTLDHLREDKITETVINTHHLAEKLENHLKDVQTPKIQFSRESKILDTGGGIKNALPYFGDDPFFVFSGDGLWDNAPNENTLQNMKSQWDPDKMDILILLQPVDSMKLTKGIGDYDLNEDGRAYRSKTQKGTYMFTSMRINAPGIFKDTLQEPFSYLNLLDKAEEEGRLYGLIHKGDWHHISTMEDLERVNTVYKQGYKADV